MGLKQCRQGFQSVSVEPGPMKSSVIDLCRYILIDTISCRCYVALWMRMSPTGSYVQILWPSLVNLFWEGLGNVVLLGCGLPVSFFHFNYFGTMLVKYVCFDCDDDYTDRCINSILYTLKTVCKS